MDTETLNPTGVKKDIRRRTFSGLYATSLTQAIKFILTIGGSAVLARLLEPADFGLVAMAIAVTGTVGVFHDFGFTTATVQRREISHAQVSNLFWINILFGFATAAVIVGIAPLVSRFFGENRLTDILRVLALSTLFSSLSGQHAALLTRDMRFAELGKRDILGLVMGQASAIALTLAGLGVWALVYSKVITAAVLSIMLWRVSTFRPDWPKRGSGTRSMVNFGANLTGVTLLNALSSKADAFLIGRFLGADAVGIYNRASNLLINTVRQVLVPLNSVFRPALSRVQDDPAQFRRIFLKAYNTIGLLALPFTAICAALSKPIVLFLYGPKWIDAVPIFAAFSALAIYWPLSTCANWILVTHGRGKDMLTKQAILSLCTVASFIVGLPWGPVGVALSYCISGFVIRLPIVFFLSSRKSPVSNSDLWLGLLRHVPSWIIAFGASRFALSFVPGWHPAGQLFFCLPIAIFVSALFIFCSPLHRGIFLELWANLRQRRISSAPGNLGSQPA